MGHREFNPGWHAAIDLKNLLTVSEAVTLAAIGSRKESSAGSAVPGRLSGEEAAECATFNIVLRQGRDGSMQLIRQPVRPLPDELKAVVEEHK